MQYWLLSVNLNKTKELSDMLVSVGFKVVPQNTNKFAKEFIPGAWDFDKISVRMYKKEYPIFIETLGNPSINSERYPHLIGKIIEIVDAKKIIGPASENYNIDFFKEAAKNNLQYNIPYNTNVS